VILNFKTFKILKTTKYIKNNNLLLFAYGINRLSNNWVLTEQKLEKLNIKYYKVFNKVPQKLFNNSIFIYSTNFISTVLFFLHLKDNSRNLEKFQIKELSSILFFVLSFKLNNKIYTLKQLKNLNSFKYIDNKLVLYKFCDASLLKNYKIFKFS
jgi:hypothetical protein